MNISEACDILEIDKDALDIPTLKNKFKRKVKIIHPDKNQTYDSTEDFKRLKCAYDFLTKLLKDDHVQVIQKIPVTTIDIRVSLEQETVLLFVVLPIETFRYRIRIRT